MKLIKSIWTVSMLALLMAGCSAFTEAQDESSSSSSASYPALQVSGDVDAPPEITHAEQPIYPRLARTAGLEGTVLIQALVDTEGRPQNVQIKSTSGTQSLDESAVAAAQKYRFKPAMKNGTPTSVTVSFPIEFKL